MPDSTSSSSRERSRLPLVEIDSRHTPLGPGSGFNCLAGEVWFSELTVPEETESSPSHRVSKRSTSTYLEPASGFISTSAGVVGRGGVPCYCSRGERYRRENRALRVGRCWVRCCRMSDCFVRFAENPARPASSPCYRQAATGQRPRRGWIQAYISDKIRAVGVCHWSAGRLSRHGVACS